MNNGSSTSTKANGSSQHVSEGYKSSSSTIKPPVSGSEQPSQEAETWQWTTPNKE